MFLVCFKGVFYQVRWEKLGEAQNSIQLLLFLSTYNKFSWVWRKQIFQIIWEPKSPFLHNRPICFNKLQSWTFVNPENTIPSPHRGQNRGFLPSPPCDHFTTYMCQLTSPKWRDHDFWPNSVYAAQCGQTKKKRIVKQKWVFWVKSSQNFKNSI